MEELKKATNTFQNVVLENREKFVNHKYKNKVEFGHNFYYFDIDKMC